MSRKEIDEISGTETTGHEWDGIRELNTPLPRWWLWTFYATIIWAIGYVIVYPAIPLVNEASKGVFGWSSRADVQRVMAEAELAQAGNLARLAQLPLEDIRKDEALTQFAVAGGRSAFKVYCSQCHGSGAEGAPGFPNLNDDDWLWGGDLESILATVRHGVRDEGDPDTRSGEMPRFGADEILAQAEIGDVTQYVLKLAGSEHDTAAAERGTALYADNCAVCHGEAGEGNRELGAPRLTDPIWLYGSDAAAIAAQIARPRHGVMPAWGNRLSEATLKQLALYVHALGGGE